MELSISANPGIAHRFVDVGLLSLAVVLLTFAHAVAGWPLEVSMIIVGLTLIVGALLARRALIGRDIGPTLTAPPVVAPRGWTMEDAQGTANWLKETASGIRDDRKLGGRKPADP